MYYFGSMSAIGAGFFFGFIAPTTKLAYQFGVSVSLAILIRYFVASLLIAIPMLYYKPSPNIFTKNIKKYLLISFGSICLTLGLLISVMHIQVSLTILIFYTYPIIILFSSIFFKKEKISHTRISLFFISFIGLIFVLSPSFQKINFTGFGFAFLAAIGAATMIITNQRMSELKINPIHINAFTNISNLIFFSTIIFFFYDFSLPANFNGWTFIIIASFCYTIAFFLQLLAIPRIGQSKTALLLYAEPIVAILSAIYLLDESLNNYQIFGAVLVLSSLAFATYITQKN